MLLLLLGCNPELDTQTWPDKSPGPLSAGAAEVLPDIPIGAPMGGFSARCKLLGLSSQQDKRMSNYALAFARSTGVHTRPWVKALWLDNGEEAMAMIKFDAIYSYDDLVREVSERLSERVGRDMVGRVTLSASHSHAMPANFSDQIHFYLGGDKFNREIFERYVDAMVEAASMAYEQRQPAAIGASWVKDWDGGAVYHDRRPENDTLQPWPDWTPGSYKDPYAHILRVDTADGEPIAMAVTFGMHGTINSEDSSMWSTDSSGGFEQVLEDQFDSPVVVMQLQGAGGDASPGGVGNDWPRTESIGELAKDAIMEAWANTPTSAAEVDFEVAGRSIPSSHDSIRVTRDGTVDWTYAPYDEDLVPDDVIYGENGEILSPIDEFNTPYGAAFCGSDDPLIPGENTGSEIPPYISCSELSTFSGVIAGTFGMDIEDFPLPLPESLTAGTLVSRLGPLPTRLPDGSEESLDLIIGFLPAEPTALFVEQWRRRVLAETGLPWALMVGYSQDHEGYFLIPEDWLAGGYEPNINIWGPLQGEHVMEGMLAAIQDVLLTDKREDPNPLGWWDPTSYEDKPLPDLAPDLSPTAGTRLTEMPPPAEEGEESYFWVPEGFELAFEVPKKCRRVDCVVQMAWIGGDPGVDLPDVRLQRQDENGEWADVLTHAGRPISEEHPDILLAHTPSPLYPATAEQTHYYWAAWQAVGHVHDRAGIPAGTYRLHVEGHSYSGGATSYPWPSTTYSVDSEPFEVLPAEISLSPGEGGISASIFAPANGWRLVSLDGNAQGANPVVGPVTVTLTDASGDITESEVEPSLLANGVSWIPVDLTSDLREVRVSDAYGNEGVLELKP